MESLPRDAFPLFVPGDRPDRFAKAAGAGTDTVIIDLEDAVAPGAKASAREGLAGGLEGLDGVQIWLRVNAVGTEWHSADMAAAASVSVHAVMLPKAENAAQLAGVRAQLRPGQALIALVETARGVHAAEDIAQASDRMAFGSVDYALDLGCQPSRDAFLLARSRLVLAARLAGRPAPLDGVTTKTDDSALVQADSAYAYGLGFGGKLLIHPRQIEPARAGFAPAPEEIAWAKRVLAEAGSGAAAAMDGEMIDAPVLERARGILARAGGA